MKNYNNHSLVNISDTYLIIVWNHRFFHKICPYQNFNVGIEFLLCELNIKFRKSTRTLLNSCDAWLTEFCNAILVLTLLISYHHSALYLGCVYVF